MPLELRVVEVVQVPATVGREAADRVRAFRDQPPQFLRRTHPSRVTAGHADNGNRLVRIAAGDDRPGRVGSQPEYLPQHERGENDGRGVVEDERGGQPQAGRRVESVAQFERGERVEAELLELPFGVHRLGAGMPEDSGNLLTHQIEDELVPLGAFQTGQPTPQRRTLRAATGAGGGAPRTPDADQAAQQLGNGPAVRLGVERGQIKRVGDEQGVVGEARRVEQGESLLRGERQHAALNHAGPALPVELSDHAAVLLPQAPGQGGGGEAVGAAVGGECVEERVRRRVVRLPGVAEHTGRRGIQHKHRQVDVTRQLVQIDRRIHLRPQHPPHLLLGQGRHQTVVQHTRRMHHTRQRVRGRHQFQGPGQLVPVRRVTGHDLGGGSGSGEFGDQFGRSRRIGAPSARQQQRPYAVTGHQVPGQHRAQRSGAPRDQHGALGVQPRPRRGRSVL